MRYLVFLICIFSINLKSEVYEIRDYTIEEEWFEAYVYWAENHFMPYGNARIEIIDFWVSTGEDAIVEGTNPCLLYTSPSPRDLSTSRMPSSA